EPDHAQDRQLGRALLRPRPLSLLAAVALAAAASVSCSSPPTAQAVAGSGGTTASGSSGGTGGHTLVGPVAMHSSSIAVSPDGSTVYVVNADADSVSVIDTATRKVLEIPLAPAPPKVDALGHYTPAIMPRALALSPGARLLYVTG